MTDYPAQKYVQPLARYRGGAGEVVEVIRTAGARGYNPVRRCPDCEKPAVRVGEGGFWPVRIRDRSQVRAANKERGLKPYRVYRRVHGNLKLTGGL